MRARRRGMRASTLSASGFSEMTRARFPYRETTIACCSETHANFPSDGYLLSTSSPPEFPYSWGYAEGAAKTLDANNVIHRPNPLETSRTYVNRRYITNYAFPEILDFHISNFKLKNSEQQVDGDLPWLSARYHTHYSPMRTFGVEVSDFSGGRAKGIRELSAGTLRVSPDPHWD